MNAYDSITVIKGSQTVVYGGGGSGGTVLYERINPRFNAGETYRAEVSAGCKSNSETKQYGADVAAGNQDWFVRSIADYIDANNSEDGDGNTVRSAYTNKDGVAILGYTPNANTRLELSYSEIDHLMDNFSLRTQTAPMKKEAPSSSDAGKTSGWGALDLFGRYEGSEHISLATGINNVFDRNYAYHVNRANSDPFNPQAIQVNEPGREYWLRLSATF